MSLPRYAAYRDSGVEWLGEVPAHWEVRRISSIFAQVAEEGDVDLPVLMVSIHSGVSDDEVDEADRNRKVSLSEDRSKYKCVAPGDLVYNMMRAWQGGFGTVTVAGLVSPAYVVARPTKTFQTRLVEHQLRSPQAIEEMRRHSRGVTDFRLRLYWDEFKTLFVTLPPQIEQTAIAAFLDRETAKIDALVAEQEKLLTLLAEKRQATISLAVTKGLNPGVPMKDSGVEWLGKVPANWEVKPMSAICSLIQTGPFGSQLHAEDYIEDGTPVINPSNLVNGRICPDWKCTVTTEMVEKLSQHVLCYGDIVIARRGEMGRCAMVQYEDVGWLCGTGSLNLRIAFGLPIFVATYLGISAVRELLKLESVGSTMENLNAGILSRVRVPFPPTTEQVEIIAFIDAETARLDALTAEASRAIDLLMERRTALISAAVTGKIDVSNALPQQEASHA